MKIDEELVVRIPVKKPRAPRPPRPPSHLLGRTEITRSWSYKLNMGNYESRDFFCSQKAECERKDAEAIAQSLHAFCKSQVMKAVREYQEELKEAMRMPLVDSHPAAQANAREFQRRQG